MKRKHLQSLPLPSQPCRQGLSALGGPLTRAVVAIGCAAAVAPAAAQSSVTISGSLDVGVNINNNAAGQRLVRLEQRHEPATLGFRGREDMGGGLTALFELVGSVAADSGTFNAWDKQAVVGLSDTRWGTLTLGRNSDTISDLVPMDPPRYNSVTGVHVGNLDRTAGNYLNNSIRYRTPMVAGFWGNLLYSLKEDGTSTTNTRPSRGANLNYQQGPLRVTAAYLDVRGVSIRPYNALGIATLFGNSYAGNTTASIVVDQRIAGIGAYYDVGGVRLLGEATEVRLKVADKPTESLRTVALGVARDPAAGIGWRPAIGADYSTLNDSRWAKVYGILDYYISRRTDVYLRVISQQASGPNQKAALYLEGPSASNRQTVTGFGMTTRF